MKYFDTKEFATKHGITPGRVGQLLVEGRIFPVKKVGRGWIIASNATVIRPPERWNRKPQKMNLSMEELSVDQQVKVLRDVLERKEW